MKMRKAIAASFAFAAATLSLASCGGKKAPKHEHAFDAGTVTTEATCTKDGVKTFKCECGETKTEAIAKKGHSEVVDAAVEATCTEPGKTAGKHCSVCNEVTVAQQTVEAHGHDMLNNGKCSHGDLDVLYTIAGDEYENDTSNKIQIHNHKVYLEFNAECNNGYLGFDTDTYYGSNPTVNYEETEIVSKVELYKSDDLGKDLLAETPIIKEKVSGYYWDYYLPFYTEAHTKYYMVITTTLEDSYEDLTFYTYAPTHHEFSPATSQDKLNGYCISCDTKFAREIEREEGTHVFSATAYSIDEFKSADAYTSENLVYYYWNHDFLHTAKLYLTDDQTGNPVKKDIRLFSVKNGDYSNLKNMLTTMWTYDDENDCYNIKPASGYPDNTDVVIRIEGGYHCNVRIECDDHDPGFDGICSICGKNVSITHVVLDYPSRVNMIDSQDSKDVAQVLSPLSVGPFDQVYSVLFTQDTHAMFGASNKETLANQYACNFKIEIYDIDGNKIDVEQAGNNFGYYSAQSYVNDRSYALRYYTNYKFERNHVYYVHVIAVSANFSAGSCQLAVRTHSFEDLKYVPTTYNCADHGTIGHFEYKGCDEDGKWLSTSGSLVAQDSTFWNISGHSIDKNSVCSSCNEIYYSELTETGATKLFTFYGGTSYAKGTLSAGTYKLKASHSTVEYEVYVAGTKVELVDMSFTLADATEVVVVAKNAEKEVEAFESPGSNESFTLTKTV